MTDRIEPMTNDDAHAIEYLSRARPRATVLLGAGRIDVWGLVDDAWLIDHEYPPTVTSTVTRRDGTTQRSTTEILLGIGRPGWSWIEARHDHGARLVDGRVPYDILEKISDLESQSDPRTLGTAK